MLIRLKIPKTILWVTNLLVIFILIFTLFRMATFFAFRPNDLSFDELIPSFLMGLRYDLRWIAVILSPVIIVSLIPKYSPFFSVKNKKWWTWYLAIVTFIVFFFFAADFGSFSYNRTRLDAGALNFVEDAGISFAMMWQTYPMFWLIMGLVVAVVFFRWMYRQSHWRVIYKTDGLGIPYRRKFFIIAAVVLAFFIYGRLSWPPLSWKDSFEFKDGFKSYLALNPLQNFFTTLKFRKPKFNEHKAREYFPLLAEKMQLPNQKGFSFRREVLPGSNALESRPNIVLVMCESFSMYKTSMSGNPMNATPYFNKMSENGIFFERCFTPHFSTARGLFAILTGIPDAQLFKFSSRNPLALKQHTIINNFTGYSKHYFLGGDPGFNNFEAILKNINGLQMHTEKNFRSPRLNVWGISDKNLFLEANKVFKKEKDPFFAIIQTSGNHRPYMIPPEDKEFKQELMDDEQLKKIGFESVNEYNSLRYFDYCFKKFMGAAEKENYFHNTIFVFIGDHGVAGNAKAIYPDAWTENRLTDEHVPLLFYAPHLLHPQKRTEVVSQIDVLPTIAGMVQEPYVNTTLGRDILQPGKKNNFAFITNSAGVIGVVTDEYYFTKNLNYPEEELVPVTFDPPTHSKRQQDSVKQNLSQLTSAFFETSRWMLMNNKRD
jgi:phosphoglycerol transferase MdoB-like AlkP superfamily enzyme